MRAGPSAVVLGVALLLGGCGRSAGEEARLAYPRPGTYPYVCTFHPHDMRGRVDVVAADGRREEGGG